VLPELGRAQGVKRLRKALKRVLWGVGVALALVVGLGLAGGLYEAVSSRGDGLAYPPRGRMVDVGGHRWRIDCVGAGSPTVVLDAGLGETGLDWSLVQPGIGTLTRVCAYDRAGMGWSEAGAGPRTPARIAGELHALLGAAGVGPPYVLVGHSLAGKYARMFAARYPGEVAGLVLVDGRPEHVDEMTSPAEQRAFAGAVGAQARAYGWARRLGVARLAGRWLGGTAAMPDRLRTEMALLAVRPGAIGATAAEARARADGDAELRAAGSLGDRPLAVLVSGQSARMTPHWEEGQRRQAGLSTDSQLIVVKGSSHFIHWDAPQVVVDAVRSVVLRARAK
jgi:pimeloyl-ACP methyl ester carboxylesterase